MIDPTMIPADAHRVRDGQLLLRDRGRPGTLQAIDPDTGTIADGWHVVTNAEWDEILEDGVEAMMATAVEGVAGKLAPWN